MTRHPAHLTEEQVAQRVKQQVEASLGATRAEMRHGGRRTPPPRSAAAARGTQSGLSSKALGSTSSSQGSWKLTCAGAGGSLCFL